MSSSPVSPLSPQLLTTVYLPSAVVLLGVGYVKASYLPFALIVPLVLYALQSYSIAVQTDPKTGAIKGVVVDEKALKPDVFQNFKLQEKTVLSHNVAIYRFALHSPTQILGLPIGQHMSVAATLTVKDKPAPMEVVRSYTPISSDENKGYFDLLIKAYPQGNISRHMTTLQIGDSLKVRGPKGAMVYSPGLVKRFGMIAGGTGITPMLQIIRAIVRGRASGDRTEVDLIFANVNEEDILLKEDLDRLTKEDAGFRVYYVLNNPPEKWNGGVGFVTPDMMKERLPAPATDMKLLMCGPPPMISAMKKAAESLGYEKARAVSKLTDQVFCF